MRRLGGQSIFSSRLHHLLLADAAIVVAFHRVNHAPAMDGLTCSVEMFERYCRFFADHFHVVSLRHLVEKLERGAPLDRELAITFDDGYRDNYECAAPILRAVGLPATFFVVSGFIGTASVAWWDASCPVQHPWMTWEQVQGLHREGFDVGAHTSTHIDLGTVSGAEAWNEIVNSRRVLEERLCAPVDLFAYPYGGERQISEDNRALVRAAGFRCCCSCHGGINGRLTDPFSLQRIPISPWYDSPYHLGAEVALRRV